MANLCQICGKSSTQSCAQCGVAFYCSREHQVADWRKSHKLNCVPFKLQTNEDLGRHYVANRDINAGETVMRKKPLVLAPKTVTVLLCLGCHKKLTIKEYSCSKCSWPLCSSSCEESDFHKDECEIMSRNSFQPNFNDGAKQSCYAFIGPLRVLLLKKKSKIKFDAIMNLQHHLDKQINTQLYSVLKRSLVPVMINNFKIDTTDEEILKICSIFDTNAFEVRDPKGTINVRGLYSMVSMISHDCKHNTKHMFNGDDFEIIVSAIVPIKKNELITTTYTQTLWGTLTRRAHLKQAKNFDCKCERCSDPTEFETYAGSIYCSSCRETNKSDACPKMISMDPMDQNAQWECESCGKAMSAKQISWGNDSIRNEILRLDKKNPRRYEEFLEKYKDLLHPKNCHILEVKYALTQMYGNMDGHLLADLSDDQIVKKINLCNELLEISEMLEPGFSRFRGSLLYDLQAAMVFQAKREFEQEKITKQAANEILTDAMIILQESAKILIMEPDMKELLQTRLENLGKYLEL